MSDFGLSQDQIDELLGGEPAASEVTGADVQALAAFSSEALGNLAGVINAMTGFEYELGQVEYAAVTPGELSALLGSDLLYSIDITIGQPAIHFFGLEQSLAKRIAATLTGGDPDSEGELGELEASAVSEVVSTINGTFMTNVAAKLKLPTNAGAVKAANLDQAAELISAGGVIGTLALSEGAETYLVHHLLSQELVTRILAQLRPAAPPPAATAAQTTAPSPSASAAAGSAASASAPTMPAVNSGNLAPATASYSPAAFGQLSPGVALPEGHNLELLLDVPLNITVELGKTSVPIKTILEYGQGSLIALDKLAGEPIDLLVNGRYFAKGEVVVIDENFGVRVTSILTPAERLMQLA